MAAIPGQTSHEGGMPLFDPVSGSGIKGATGLVLVLFGLRLRLSRLGHAHLLMLLHHLNHHFPHHFLAAAMGVNGDCLLMLSRGLMLLMGRGRRLGQGTSGRS